MTEPPSDNNNSNTDNSPTTPTTHEHNYTPEELTDEKTQEMDVKPGSAVVRRLYDDTSSGNNAPNNINDDTPDHTRPPDPNPHQQEIILVNDESDDDEEPFTDTAMEEQEAPSTMETLLLKNLDLADFSIFDTSIKEPDKILLSHLNPYTEEAYTAYEVANYVEVYGKASFDGAICTMPKRQAVVLFPDVNYET
jgi:hypothetical protein